MGSLFNHRRRWLIAGIVVGVIVAGAAIAAIIATARVNDNNVATPLIEAPPPPPPAIAVAVEPDQAQCNTSLNLGEISSSALFNGTTLDYSDPYFSPVSASTAGQGHLCVKNLSVDTSYSVVLSLESVVSLDLGCDPDEVAAGDVDCDSMDPGELGDGSLVFALVAVDGAGSFCDEIGISLSEPSGLNAVANLDPSGWCAWDVLLFDFNAYVNATAPDPIYSTDNVTFDVVLDADDAVVLTDWYPDNDGDSFGDADSPPIQLFFAPSGYVDNNLDCDDDNVDTYPGATEDPGDLIDNDCDGLVDEI